MERKRLPQPERLDGWRWRLRAPGDVWIHGGAYVAGAGSDRMYDGGNLACATGTVVVTINYRLSAFGFLHLAELLGPDYADSSNVALLDHLEALR